MSIREEQKQKRRQALLNAALHLSTVQYSFSHLSLREVTSHVGIVPAAFYRYFKDLDQLSLELIDQVALHIKGSLHHICHTYIYQPHAKLRTSLDLFFQTVEQHPEHWRFLVIERFGASPLLRQAIAREIHFLIDDLSTDFLHLESLKHISTMDHLKMFTRSFIQLALNWAMDWLELIKSNENKLLDEKIKFKQLAYQQSKLLFLGIQHWETQNN